MPEIWGTRVEPSNTGDRPNLVFSAVIGWTSVEDTNGDFDVNWRVWEHDDGEDDDRSQVGTIRVPTEGRLQTTLEFAFPFLFRFRRIRTPTRTVPQIIGEGTSDWGTEAGDEEIYLRISLVDRSTGTVVDRVRTRIVTGNW